MGHARASDLMQSLIEVLKDLDYVNKMVQISMDGPSVNWALLDNLSIHRKEINVNAPDLVNLEAVVFTLCIALLSQYRIRQIGTLKRH